MKGYGISASVKEILIIGGVIVGSVIVVLYIVKKEVSEALPSSDSIKKAFEPIQIAYRPIENWGVENVGAPIAKAVLGIEEGEKTTIGDKVYGIFAEPPPKNKFEQAKAEAEKILYAGKGGSSRDGDFVDISIEGNITRFILNWEKTNISWVSIPKSSLITPSVVIP